MPCYAIPYCCVHAERTLASVISSERRRSASQKLRNPGFTLRAQNAQHRVLRVSIVGKAFVTFAGVHGPLEFMLGDLGSRPWESNDQWSTSSR